MYRHHGRLRRLTIGTYPGLGLADARDKAKELLHQTALGKDPATEKQVNRGAPTFGELARDYIEMYAKPHKRSWEEDQRMLDHDLLPRWKNSKAQDIKRRDVIALLDSLVQRAPIQANRTLALLRKLYNWAISRDLVDVNPCAQVKMPAKENQKDRVLNEEEIRTFWHGLTTASMTEFVRLCLKLQLVTAQRKGEIVGAEWSEFDLNAGWWTIPAGRAKNKLAHRVPLSSLALDILSQIRVLSADSRWKFVEVRRVGIDLQPSPLLGCCLR